MRRKNRGGAAAMEFVLLMPMLIVMVFGIIEFSFFISHFHHLQRAARDGARVGSLTLEGATPTGDLIEQAATEQAVDVLQANGLNCGVSHDCGVTAQWVDLLNNDTRWIVVRVEVPYQSLTGVFPDLASSSVAEFSAVTQQQLPIVVDW